MNSALVLFSGGQDSTVCLAWALQRFDVVHTIGFDYGQRHSVELSCRAEIIKKIADAFPQWRHKIASDQVIDLKSLNAISETALTREAEISFNENGLPNTFVPGRNLIFFNFAAALAYRLGAAHLVGGMCETDYSGYPDCRDETLKALERAINLGMDAEFKIHTPLMWIDKAQTWRIAQEFGGLPLVNIIINDTHSCYKGERSQKHAWGYGCDACPACELRKAGYEGFICC
ncbi:MAG: 7-cyano-7-deazaguanine synthase QueC [Alphaproteobacteria bacterium]|nr:7-cyano-7-deazaguanine synthase QueC [Alphaproteobacteria bacterium]